MAHESMPVCGTLKLSEREQSASSPGYVQRNLDDSGLFATQHLHEYCYSQPSNLSQDISTLIVAVKLADRAFARQHSKGWGRKLCIEIPVFELQRWRSEDVTQSLQDALQYLTADEWNFTFVKRRRKLKSSQQSYVVNSPSTKRVFIPFSHGLDSYAQMRHLKALESTTEVVSVNVNAGSGKGSFKSLGIKNKSGPKLVTVATRMREPHHAEPSFRSRPFVYNMMAAYGAAMTKSNLVLIPENGQGSLGGSLALLGSEAPHRSCHPGFTSRLTTFVKALTSEHVTFKHPALFQTKGQVLSTLLGIEPNSDEWLSTHRSCSYDSRHAHHAGKSVHCGVCGNCVLRRMSIFTAGIKDNTTYRAKDIHCSELEQSFIDAEIPKELKAYKDLAFNSARSMQRLADYSSNPSAPRLWGEIDSLARHLQREPKQIKEEMFELLENHASEWSNYLRHCGKSSWLAQLARE